MRFVILALLMVLSSSVSAQEVLPDHQPGQGPAEDDPTTEAPEEPRPVAPIILKSEPPEKEHDGGASEHSDGHPPDHLLYGDGLAQWAMAFLAFATTVLSGFAVWLLYRTLKATRDAVEQAKIGTDAALVAASATIKANDIAQRNSIAQLRPYIVVDGIKCRFEPNPANIESDVRVFVQWRNYGQTPATAMKWGLNSKVTVGSSGLPSSFDFPDGDIEFSSLGPTQESRDISIIIDGGEYRAAKSGIGQIFMWGWVEYSDGFPETPRRRSEICVRLDPVEDDRIFLPNTHETHNGADTDCLKPPMTAA